MLRYLLCFVPLIFVGCYSDEGPSSLQPATTICLPVSARQSVSSGGQQTNTMAYEFGYDADRLRSLTLITSTASQSFSATHTASQLAQLTDGSIQFQAEAGGQRNRPARVSISRAGAEQATYTFTYEADRLTKLTEARTVLPADWYVRSRLFTFAYSPTGELTQEKVINTFTDGSTVTQTTSYTASAAPAPFADCTDPALLTALTLYYRLEALSARFWQKQASLRYETWQARTGSADALVTRAQFTLQQNAEKMISQQTIAVTTYPAGNPFPQERALQQTFTYLCR